MFHVFEITQNYFVRYYNYTIHLLLVIFLDIRVPLMWKDNVHFSGKTGGELRNNFGK